MNRYELAIATADFLEQNPERFNYFSGLTPESERHQGCLLGHMGRIAGIPQGISVRLVSHGLLGMAEFQVYNMLTEYQGGKIWAASGELASAALRKAAKADFAHLNIPESWWARKMMEQGPQMKGYAKSIMARVNEGSFLIAEL